ncbi:MAG: YedE-related selenium metabolism membrane protein [Campylobacter sp.]|nr:YedE-related selenium metabolism membrane protein [Campylobacter sp.]
MSKNTTLLFVITGSVLGGLAALLAYFGNPANMGICAACFIRDVTGSLGFHRAAMVQYARPEIVGLVLGGLVAAVFSGNFKAVSGSSPFTRFTLGIFAMIGCLVFLGCPWRAFLRLGGGDMTALFGVLGLFAGVVCGRAFKKRGYKLSKDIIVAKEISLLPVIFVVLLFLALIFGLKVGENSALFLSQKGPGSQHANIWISLVLAAIVGFFIKKSGFCSVGAISKAIDKNYSMFWGVIGIIVVATVVNLALGQYKFGFEDQPIAHNDMLWNFLGMTLAGLCFSLAEGCPGKHLAQSGGGNLNSVIFLLGMAAGAAVCHNFNLASSATGITEYAPYAVIFGFIVCAYIGFTNKSQA